MNAGERLQADFDCQNLTTGPNAIALRPGFSTRGNIAATAGLSSVTSVTSVTAIQRVSQVRERSSSSAAHHVSYC